MTSSQSYETLHVHSVYESIAPHFAQTRHKPWPLISRFLLSLPPGAVGLDVGCGNGKYLAINPDIFILGSDRSGGLVEIARKGVRCNTSNDVVVGDILDLPHGKGRFDFVICVAVVHHLSTRERRVRSIGFILETLRPGRGESEGKGGRALIYVWALEQKSSRRGWDEGGEQDVMVPWVMKHKEGEKTFERYYHLYRKGELEEDILEADGRVLESGYEKDNWWAVAESFSNG